MELTIYREYNYIYFKDVWMCGHITTHYMYIQDMLHTVLAFQVTTLYTYQSTMLHSAHQ